MSGPSSRYRKPAASMIRRCSAMALAMATTFAVAPSAFAQTGVDDDRVNLPDGPGSLEGVGDNVELDPNMGSMSWSVPIVLPRGFVTPEVAIQYSSAAGNGPLGVGWSMPSPTIERMTSRGIPDYDAADTMVADGGTELVLVDDSDPNALVYRERFEKSFKRYTWIEGGAQGYWKVEMPDGSIGYYGALEDGTLEPSARSGDDGLGTFRYHLVEVVDPYGHAARYHYDKFDSNRALLTRIDYLFVEDEPLYSVAFDYEAREDDLSDANSGYEDRLTMRLSSLSVLANATNQTVRAYALDYESYEDSGGMTRLASVKRYGKGGIENGEVYPIAYDFDYSKALGTACDDLTEQCGTPKMYSAGKVPGLANLASGTASLVDLNGDSLPDVVDTSQNSAHQIFLAKLTADASGAITHTFEDGVESATGLGGTFRLGEAGTQILDVDGDGRSDLLSPQTGSWLRNDPDSADWLAPQSLSNIDKLVGLDFGSARFLDYDNDRRIDLLTSQAGTTTVYVNTPDGFDTENIDSLGVTFADSQVVQLADMNGDGQQDVVELLDGGAVHYKLNLGNGRFSTGWIDIVGVNVDSSVRDLVELEDLNGDGLSDLVLVTSGGVKYALNRNGERFDDWKGVDPDKVDGMIPSRDEFTTVLFADMNANGSEDIVWLTSSGDVDYLELFPVRPNLLSRIDNGIGSVQKITYSSAVSHMARAEQRGESWTRALSMATMVVEEIDLFVKLTGSEDGSGLHEVTSYAYSNGFYDGQEKQYRGFEKVQSFIQAGEHQESGGVTWSFDVGATQPWRSGLMLEKHTYSGERLLLTRRSNYESCDLAEVPTPAALESKGRYGVYFPCATREEFDHVEGDESTMLTVATDYTHDGYGKITLEERWGIVDIDGDEQFISTEYAEPENRWILGLPSRQQTWNDPNGQVKTEDRFYYDGSDFEGAALGEFTHGFMSRHEQRIDDERFRQVMRQRRDEHGNAVEVIAPNGALDAPDVHRRLYGYDASGILLESVDINTRDAQGSPYSLRREFAHDPLFQEVTSSTEQMIRRDDQNLTPADPTTYAYDDFGRLSQSVRPGDTEARPSSRYAYDMGERFTQIEVAVRGDEGIVEAIECLDGQGRRYQTRRQIEPGKYLVSGFVVYNARGHAVRLYQPYESGERGCEESPPEQIPYTSYTLDAMARELSMSKPGEQDYGERLTERYEYLPLARATHDTEDTHEGGAMFDTPTIERYDGLKRLIAHERTSRDESGNLERATTTLHYDETGSFAGYTDPMGMRHEQVVDLAGRVTRIENANLGRIDMTHDDAGNVTSRTDSRGVTVRSVYDGLDRLQERWDEADAQATKITYHYDLADVSCAEGTCDRSAGELVRVDYPLPQDTALGQIGDGYDAFGFDERRRRTTMVRHLGTLGTWTTTRHHDKLDRVVALEHPNGERIDYHYDDAGRLINVPGHVDGFVYDARNLLTRVDFANGARTEMTYDGLLRQSSRMHYDALDELIEGQRFERDRFDNVTRELDALDEQRITTHTYDDWYRLTGTELAANPAMNREAESLAASYDVLDRPTMMNSTGQALALSYDASHPAQIASAGEMAFDYDASGHLTSRGEASFEWDHFGRLTRVVGAQGQTQTVYGAGPDRLMRLGDDGSTLYGFEGFEVRDGVATNYVKIDKRPVSRIEDPEFATQLFGDGNADGKFDAGDAYLATLEGTYSLPHMLGAAATQLLAGDEAISLHTDRLGSLVAAVDAGGELVGQRAYYPYGQVRAEKGFVDHYGFTGQEHDAHVPVIYFQYRALDPVMGRWMSVDPMFVELEPEMVKTVGESTTAYAYVRNNPVNGIDPTGLTREKERELTQQAAALEQKARVVQAKIDRINQFNDSTNSAAFRMQQVRPLFSAKEQKKMRNGKLPFFFRTKLGKMETQFTQEASKLRQQAQGLRSQAQKMRMERKAKQVKAYRPKAYAPKQIPKSAFLVGPSKGKGSKKK